MRFEILCRYAPQDFSGRLRRRTNAFITHAHIDHIGGAAKLKRLTGAPVLLNANDQVLLKMLDLQATWCGMRPPEKTTIDTSITTGDKLKTGSLVAEVMHTPGHTEGSVCLYLASEKKLIAGEAPISKGVGVGVVFNCIANGVEASYPLYRRKPAGSLR